MRILSLYGIEKNRNHLVADPIDAYLLQRNTFRERLIEGLFNASLLRVLRNSIEHTECSMADYRINIERR